MQVCKYFDIDPIPFFPNFHANSLHKIKWMVAIKTFSQSSPQAGQTEIPEIPEILGSAKLESWVFPGSVLILRSSYSDTAPAPRLLSRPSQPSIPSTGFGSQDGTPRTIPNVSPTFRGPRLARRTTVLHRQRSKACRICFVSSTSLVLVFVRFFFKFVS